MHRIASTIALAVIFVSCAKEDDLPALGASRVTNLHGRPSEFPVVESSPSPRALFRVDYRGPREIAEIYVENWDGTTLVSTATLYHQKFGSTVLERHDCGTNSAKGPAFSHVRVVFAVCLIDLPETLPDGRKTLAIVNTGTSDEPTFARTTSTLVRLDAGGRSEREIFPSLGSSAGSDVCPDTEIMLLWEAQAATLSTRVYFRVVDK